ncbi:1543_t:CDS:2, partial [Dentiscutata heterogama]
MPIDEVHQTILVKYIPDSLNLTVYDINPIVPNDRATWYCDIDLVNGSIGIYNTDEKKKTWLLFDISISTRN